MNEKVKLYSVTDTIRKGESELKRISKTAFLDSEVLFCKASGFSRTDCISKCDAEVSLELKAAFEELLARRKTKEPVAYIVGDKEFWGHSFKVNSAVLIPRPETEMLVERGVEIIKDIRDQEILVADLGTGSGCVAISIAIELVKLKKNFRIVATDISEEALGVALENAKAHHVESYIEFGSGNWFEPYEGKRKMDLIVCNPPYISSQDKRVDKELKFEPQFALYSGMDGMDAIREILVKAKNYITPTGSILFEFGAGQAAAIETFNKKTSPELSVTFLRDIQGYQRVAELKRIPPEPVKVQN